MNDAVVDETDESNDADLDRGALLDRYRRIVIALALVLVAAMAWYLGTTAKDASNGEATAKAQTFSLAQEVAAACASDSVGNDMSALCDSATTITREGPAGAAGAAGDQGEQGATGFPGKDGEPGAIGASGVNGINGINGVNGEPGSGGSVGSTGATGDTGATGADGTPGAPGETGPAGVPGADGASAYPFTFVFTTAGQPGTYSCTLTSSTEPAVCTPVG